MTDILTRLPHDEEVWNANVDLSVVQGGEPAGIDQPLLTADQASGFRERWQDVQISFVDEPRHGRAG